MIDHRIGTKSRAIGFRIILGLRLEMPQIKGSYKSSKTLHLQTTTSNYHGQGTQELSQVTSVTLKGQ